MSSFNTTYAVAGLVIFGAFTIFDFNRLRRTTADGAVVIAASIRALPADQLGEFVSSLARRIAGFPAAGHAVVKDRVNAIALAPVEDFRRDFDLFGEGVRAPEAQGRIGAAMRRGFQTRDPELALARLLGDAANETSVAVTGRE
jgi:hypothetical protein